MNIKVLKFGGTSVADAQSRAAAARRVAEAREEGFAPVAVVSAIGRKGAPYATDTLIHELRNVNSDLPIDVRDLDLIMACGEIISACVFAQTLRSLGLNATAMTGMQAGITTDGLYGSARICTVDPTRIFKVLEQNAIPVICGFQGVAEDDHSEITTLGRGGTDTTAAAIGAALKASTVEIYTDVDGIKTADPNWVSTAVTLRKAGYDEVAEMAHLGAKVLHPRAAEIAMKYSTPLWVKNTLTEEPGTEIVSEDVSYNRNITGITHSGHLVYLQFDLSEPGLKERVSAALARAGISLYMVNVSSSGLSFGVSTGHFEKTKDILADIATPAEVVEGCSMISVIGRTYFGKPGVFYRILSILQEEFIPVFQTGDSDFSVSFLIPEADTRRAVQVLHDALVPAEVS